MPRRGPRHRKHYPYLSGAAPAYKGPRAHNMAEPNSLFESRGGSKVRFAIANGASDMPYGLKKKQNISKQIACDP